MNKELGVRLFLTNTAYPLKSTGYATTTTNMLSLHTVLFCHSEICMYICEDVDWPQNIRKPAPQNKNKAA